MSVLPGPPRSGRVALRCATLALSLVILASPALARECPLAQSVFEPVDAPGAFTMSVAAYGHGYRFVLGSKALKRETTFAGSYENGTGHLNLIEDTGDADRDGIVSRAVLFRQDLKTADPWNKGPKPVAYAYFETLAAALWDRARMNAEDDKAGASPPDGLWRIARCRAR